MVRVIVSGGRVLGDAYGMSVALAGMNPVVGMATVWTCMNLVWVYMIVVCVGIVAFGASVVRWRCWGCIVWWVYRMIVEMGWIVVKWYSWGVDLVCCNKHFA